MDIKKALTGQYRAGLSMMRQCISDFPDQLWNEGIGPRKNWKIAAHGLFYTHLYAMQREQDFKPWRLGDYHNIWKEEAEAPVWSKEDILGYCDYIDENIGDWIDNLDLESEESGFDWYPNIGKLDHQILNIWHMAGHMGQLSELAMNNGVDEIKWCTRVPR